MADPNHPDIAKLPPGFVVVPSSSRPGQVSYLHKASGKKYMTIQQCWDVHAGGAGGGATSFKIGARKSEGGGNQAQYAPSKEQLKLIQKVLSTNDETTKAGKVWYKKYNVGKPGQLNQEELRKCIEALNSEIGLPPLNDDRLLDALMKKFDTNKNGFLEFTEFLCLYAAILRRVRDKYIKAGIRRDFFIDKNKTGKPEDFYKTLKKLGEGSFGLVYLVEDLSSHQERVLKVVNKAKSAMPPEELQLEIDTLKSLDHPHIIRLFEYFEDYNNIYIVMETAKGGELLDVIESNYKAGYRLNEQWISVVYTQVLNAISYVHARGIMHKDLKAENIMLLDDGNSATQPHAVVIDLGLAEMFDKVTGKSKNIAGTPVTMAPEVWNQSFGPKCDVWSLGVVLYQLLSGKLPFIAKTCKKKDWLAVLTVPPNWKRVEHASQPVRQLLSSMLTVDENKRPTCSECLQFQWFRDAPGMKDVHLSENTMDELMKYHERSDLEKVVRMQVASQLSANKLPKLNAIFRKYDVDNNGTLSMDELAGALQELGVDPAVCKRAAESLDVDNSGYVEYTEFVAGCLNFFDNNLDAMLWKAFQKIDVDHSGSLSIDEIGQLLTRGAEFGLGNISPDASQVRQMIARLDKNGDGKVDWDEFKAFFTPKL
ncbi:unnamed protein product [Amoebophrya sp. A120]|nr:unnamed protein product [Amoebophrya sp. A120]|eukprot:GSA120T00015523001.1